MIQNSITAALYLLAMINPISKICILSVFTQEEKQGFMAKVLIRSSVIALFILLISMGAGEIILHKIFYVELYSLKLSGGIILFLMGFKALTKGVFFDVDTKNRFEDLSIVPLASPMIAGPATIAASLSLSSQYGFLSTAIAIFLASGLNLIFMLLAKPIGHLLMKYNFMGALIRLTGLIVSTIGAQMMLSGIMEWIKPSLA